MRMGFELIRQTEEGRRDILESRQSSSVILRSLLESSRQARAGCSPAGAARARAKDVAVLRGGVEAGSPSSSSPSVTFRGRRRKDRHGRDRRVGSSDRRVAAHRERFTWNSVGDTSPAAPATPGAARCFGRHRRLGHNAAQRTTRYRAQTQGSRPTSRRTITRSSPRRRRAASALAGGSQTGKRAGALTCCRGDDHSVPCALASPPPLRCSRHGRALNGNHDQRPEVPIDPQGRHDRARQDRHVTTSDGLVE